MLVNSIYIFDLIIMNLNVEYIKKIEEKVMICKLFFDFLLKTLGQIIKGYLLQKYLNKNFIFKNLNRIKIFLARFKIQLYHKIKNILIQLYRFNILFI
jgi:hypothetical protein